MNHKGLVDELKASLSGEDVGVFYRANESSLPVEIDRIISNVYTGNTSVQFRTQEAITANTIDANSYALVFGGKPAHGVKADKKNVFAFFEDFSTSDLREWTRVWGEWTVKNGHLFGKTGKSAFGYAEVGLYLTKGKAWKDIEVDLDFMETGSHVVYTGPLFRVQDLGYIIQQPGGLSIKQIVKTVP